MVENIGGGAAIPGMVAGRGAQPDGYTLLMGTSAAMVVNPAIMQKLPYDPFNDFVLIGPVFRNPLAIFANDKAPYNSLKDLVDAAKKDPGKLNWGYPGAGTTQHLTGELFKQVAGVNIQGVMYKGSAQVVNDLLGDQIQLSVDGIPAEPAARQGRQAARARLDRVDRARRNCPTCRRWPSSVIRGSRARAGAASSSPRARRWRSSTRCPRTSPR